MTFVAVVIPPPQLKVAPAVVDVAVKVSLVFKQFKTVGGLMPAFGAVMFCVTVTKAVAVHPFEGSVTVTVNPPGAVMLSAAVVFPPPQLKVAPFVVEVAVKVWLVLVQVKTVGGLMPALGAVMF